LTVVHDLAGTKQGTRSLGGPPLVAGGDGWCGGTRPLDAGVGTLGLVGDPTLGVGDGRGCQLDLHCSHGRRGVAGGGTLLLLPLCLALGGVLCDAAVRKQFCGGMARPKAGREPA
jgi:hypothetical protein